MASQQRRKKIRLWGFNDVGSWCTKENEIAAVADNYFKTLFTTTHTDNANMEVVLDSMDKRVTANMNHILLQPYTASEVKRALF